MSIELAALFDDIYKKYNNNGNDNKKEAPL